MESCIRRIGIILLSLILLASCSKSTEQQIAEQLELGQKYLAELDYEAAIAAFDKVIEIDPKNVEAYTSLAHIYAAQEDYAAVVETMETGITVVSQDVFDDDTMELLKISYENLIKVTDAVGENELVLQYYDRLLTYFPDDEEQRAKRDNYAELTRHRQELQEMAEKIMMEEDYDFSDQTILSDAFQELIKNLQEKISFQSDGDTFIVIYPGGYIYSGQMQDGKREGHGIWYYGTMKRLTKVDTIWVDDLPNGEALITELINPAEIERKEGKTYAVKTIQRVTLADGVYDGAANVVWNMESGNVHDWDLTFADGYALAPYGDGIVAYCKNCGADLSYKGEYKILGIDYNAHD